jgi:membrane associated rhomboid family serine protease
MRTFLPSKFFDTIVIASVHRQIMGIYDRDYEREQPTAWDRAQNPRSITVTLIIVNVVVFVAELITRTQVLDPFTQQPLIGANGRPITDSVVIEWLAVNAATIKQPWMWWQFLTYGFVHDVSGPTHVLFNMIGLYVFGRDVEQRLGRSEFLRFYLVAVVAGGIVGAITHAMMGGGSGTIGASGAVIACAILFACFFPHRELLLMLVLPVKAWVLAVIFVLADMAGAFGFLWGAESSSNTAFTVHLAGAFFALGYYFLGWNFRKLDFLAIGDLPQRLRQRSRRMRLKIHDPDRGVEREAEEADRILAKIHDHGESSLTPNERKILERYSRRQREKREL